MCISQEEAVNGVVDEDVMMEDEKPQNVEYVSEQLDVKDPALEAFSNVFARFQAPAETTTVRVHAYICAAEVHLCCLLGPRRRAHERGGHLLGRRYGL